MSSVVTDITNPGPRSDAGTATTDVQAREAVRGGQRREALAILMDAYGERVYRFCRSMLRDEALTADVRQGVFVAAYEGLAERPEIESFPSWLLTIARNRCLDALKARRRWVTRFRHGDAPHEEVDPAPSSDQILVGREGRHALLDCLAALSPHVRMAVVMHHQEGVKFEEMSRLVGERPSTLQARVARALPALRLCLERKGWAPR